MKDLLSPSGRRYIGTLLIAAVAYVATNYLSLFLVPDGGTASVIWPVSAVGLTILYYWGLEMWPALLLPMFVLLLTRGIIPPLALGVAAANTLESVLGVYILYRLQFSPKLARLRDSLALIGAAFVACFVAAVLITTSVKFFGSTPGVFNFTLMTSAWVGHIVSIVSFGSFLLRWFYQPRFRKTSKEIIEGIIVFGIITALNVLTFWTPYGSADNISFIYILIIPLIWASLRTGPRGISLALFLTAGIAVTGVLYGFGPISTLPNLGQVLFGIQILIGTLSLIFLLFTSITEERKDAVSALEGHVTQLEQALQKISSEDQAKSDFIAILAHELRNPLSPILSGVELLKVEHGKTEVLKMMDAHLNTLARLLDDLLDITRISQKKFKLTKQPIEIHEIMDRTLEMVRPYMSERKHELLVDIPHTEIWLNGDPVRLEQIFVNLLNNSAKYTEPGGKIKVTISRSADMLTVRIKDNGIGIESERIPRVFEAFGGPEGNSRRPGGLRIGLSLAKRMAEMHQGIIHVSSEGVGKGSEFTVRIPLPAAMPLPLVQEPRTLRNRFSRKQIANDSERIGKIKILVVDDNQDAANNLSKLLTHHGHETIVAYDAPEALDIVRTITPHVALLDIGLPTMDGHELGSRLRAQFGENITLVALTGYGQPEDKEKARKAGFNEHLVKPVAIADVLRVLAELRINN